MSPISCETVRRVLKQLHFKSKKRIKKLSLTLAQKKNRLKWALEHKNWTVDGARVICSDETKINRLNSDGIKYCWARPTDNLSSSQVEETLKFGGIELYYGMGVYDVGRGGWHCYH